MNDITPTPQPGTIAYALWKQRQEQDAQEKPGNQETGKPENKKTPIIGPPQPIEPTKPKPTPQKDDQDEEKPFAEADLLLGNLPDDRPTRKVSFMFTDEEKNMLEDLKHSLRRKHDIQSYMNDLARAAVQLLVEDFKKKGGKSFIVDAFYKRNR